MKPLVTRLAIFFPLSLNELKKEGLPVVQCFFSLLLQNRAAFDQKKEVLNDPFRLKRGKFTNAEQKAGPRRRPCFVSCPGFLAKFIN